MQLTFDDKLDEDVYFEELDEETVAVEEETSQTAWLGRVLEPIQNTLSKDVHPLVKVLAVLAFVLVALLLLASVSGLIYASLLPFMASLPLVGWPLFFVIMAVLALIALVFFVPKVWSWFKELPKKKREETFAKMQGMANNLWVEGKRLIEF